jgi:hypothetical protein
VLKCTIRAQNALTCAQNGLTRAQDALTRAQIALTRAQDALTRAQKALTSANGRSCSKCTLKALMLKGFLLSYLQRHGMPAGG